MNFKTAHALAKEYSAQRREIRKALLNECQRREELAGYTYDEDGYGSSLVLTEGEQRKLHSYPADLSDDRLLKMLDRLQAAIKKGTKANAKK